LAPNNGNCPDGYYLLTNGWTPEVQLSDRPWWKAYRSSDGLIEEPNRVGEK
jgi:hypothetical protein